MIISSRTCIHFAAMILIWWPYYLLTFYVLIYHHSFHYCVHIVNTGKSYSRKRHQLMSSLRIYRKGIHYGIEKYLKSLRFWENQIWTSHKCSNVRFFLRKERLLRALEPDNRAFLEVEKIHFLGPQARKGQFLLMWKLPKDNTSSSLSIVWA